MMTNLTELTNNLYLKQKHMSISNQKFMDIPELIRNDKDLIYHVLNTAKQDIDIENMPSVDFNDQKHIKKIFGFDKKFKNRIFIRMLREMDDDILSDVLIHNSSLINQTHFNLLLEKKSKEYCHFIFSKLVERDNRFAALLSDYLSHETIIGILLEYVNNSQYRDARILINAAHLNNSIDTFVILAQNFDIPTQRNPYIFYGLSTCFDDIFTTYESYCVKNKNMHFVQFYNQLSIDEKKVFKDLEMIMNDPIKNIEIILEKRSLQLDIKDISII